MVKLLLKIFPTDVIYLLGLISLSVVNLLVRKRVISDDISLKLMLCIALAALFFVGVREYIGRFKIYENIASSKIYINIWKAILIFIIVTFFLL
jgi:hypothetical protein